MLQQKKISKKGRQLSPPPSNNKSRAQKSENLRRVAKQAKVSRGIRNGQRKVR